MSETHCVISNHAEFQALWAQVLAGKGPLTRYAEMMPVADLLLNPPRSCVLDMRIFSTMPEPLSLMNLAKATCLLLAFGELSVDAELAWLAVGVKACCTPDLPLARLQVIVDVTSRDGIWVSTGALPFLLKGLQHYTASHSVNDTNKNLKQLTPQERKIANLVAQGQSNKLIARELNISDRTVKTHLSTIFSKLNISDRVHLALFMNRQF